MKAPPSLQGVVINTKLFSRPRKDQNLRAKSKREVEVLKGKYSDELKVVKQVMIDKIVQLLEGRTSQGVKHKFGDDIIPKGTKFTKKLLTEGLFPAKNPFKDESNYA